MKYISYLKVQNMFCMLSRINGNFRLINTNLKDMNLSIND